MLSIVYSSRATSAFDGAALRGLLAQSRRNNETDGLTGMLLYRSGYFLQVLEGPDPNVRARMTEIQRDPRHTDIRRLIEEPTQQRLFSDWTMGFQELTPDDADLIPGARTAFDDLTEDHATSATINAVRALIVWYRQQPN